MKKSLKCMMVMLLIWACMPSLVSAHAYIAQSTPYSDAELTAAPPAIRLTFTEKIDTKLSNLSLKRIDNGSEINGVLSGEDDLTLKYKIPKLADGIYEVNWQVLSLDSHFTDGSFQFAVGVKLAHVQPDDTASLDGGGNTGAGLGSGDTVTEKPTATEKPKPIDKPASSPKPTAAIIPIVKPTPASESEASALPSPPASLAESSESSPSPTVPVIEDSASGGDTKIGSVTEPDKAETAEVSDAADAVESTPQEEAASENEHSTHAGQGTSSHAEAGEHEHAGGHGSMVALRVLDLITSVFLLGILFFRYILWRSEEEKAPYGFSLHAERIVIAVAVFIWVISGFTRLSMLSEQLGGISIFTIASSSMLGKIAVMRPVLALLLLLLAFAPSKERHWANPVKFVVAVALIVSFPLTGHAYAALEAAVAAVVAHAFHMTAAAVWFGGLAGLFAMTFEKSASERLNQAAASFSAWALPSMLLILLSGIWLAAARLSAWGQLFSTDYGKLIVAKTSLMLLVLVVGALHMIVFMPRISQHGARRGLLLGIRAEVLLAAALFVAAGWLSSTSPPADAAIKLSEPIYWHVMGEDAHMSMRISENKQEQTAKLDVWLPEGLEAPVSAKAIIRVEGNSVQEPIPFVLQPREAQLFEYPGFTKYTYLATGEFIDEKDSSLITIDIQDEEGHTFHYERSFFGAAERQ
ncbi:copper resistance protein CopC [Paenibacillus sinopodophylli]|uniref:copper resistance protein CopC n=1 Tax=Paenibacillus sinopodophylli TaxID=1837342 RepID=UPI00110CD202|nr:copper resistance protein CopC [Paenibacillus sinopodophylli]